MNHLRIIDNTTKNTTLFKDVEIGAIFKYNNQICIKTNPFYEDNQIEDYFNEYYSMEYADDLIDKGYECYNALNISNGDVRSIMIRNDTKVVVLEAELHIL